MRRPAQFLPRYEPPHRQNRFPHFLGLVFSLFSFFSVFSVLRLFPNCFNTENTEKTEATENLRQTGANPLRQPLMFVAS